MSDIHAAAVVRPRPALSVSRLRHAGFAVSLTLTALTAGAMLTRGLDLGLDFTGGVLVESRGPVPWDVGALRLALGEAGAPAASVQLADGGVTAIVRTPADDPTALDAVRAALGRQAEIRAEEVVGPRVSGEVLRSGALACLSAVVAIAIYVWLRFEARFGAAAFIATLHDVVMMLGLYAVTGITFDLTSVAAMLAIAGYSINDTVVVFDRVREMLRTDRAAALDAIVDRAVADTLRRTLMTSGTTLAASTALMAFGGPVLFGFAAAVTFGVIVGTLSSIFIAAPLLLHLPGPLPGRVEPATDGEGAP